MNTSAVNAPRALSDEAVEFRPCYTDTHCLFLTFSNGFPLTQGQVFDFFNELFAPYVEHVYVHRPRPVDGVVQPSLFGKVMFKHRNLPNLVMRGRDRVCLAVDGYPLYCRRFVHQANRAGPTHQT